MDDIHASVAAALGAVEGTEREILIEEIHSLLQKYSPRENQPIDWVRWVPIEDVQPNDYNPNAVAKREMRLLQVSILADGYTQPVVTFFDEELKKYVIVDGFHRYYCCKLNEEIRRRTLGRLPIVVIEKDLADRMASTVRHNRARGSHSVAGMSDLVFGMLKEGRADEDICNELGMEAEELLKLKHITGFSKLFKDLDYGPSWEGETQLRERLAFERQSQVVEIESSGKEETE